MKTPKLTQERVKELFDYCEETGTLTRKHRRGKWGKGDPVGCLRDCGLVTEIDRYKYTVHDLIWLWHYGENASSSVIHIDGDVLNNRIANLALCLKYYKISVITQEDVRYLFNYDKESGKLTRRIPACRGSNQHKSGMVGEEVGTQSLGYLHTSIGKKIYKVHRLIWLWVEGYLPENQIDHINRDSLDNRWCNLREVSQQCNVRNTGNFSHNKSGVKGVHLRRSGGLGASIKMGGKSYNIGYHGDDFVEAVAYRLAAEQCLDWEGCDSSSPAYQYMQKFIKGEL